jgi:hypothetical protein
MFLDPAAASLLLDIFGDVAREGIPRLFAYVDRRYGTTEYDLSGGAPITARVRFTFRAVPGTAPYWVLLGMQSGDGKRLEVPVRYGDPLEIVVPRAWYELVALFLSKPLTPTHKPTLLALAAAYEGAIGARQQQVSLVGEYPSRELVAWLDQHIPRSERPFQLPTRSLAQLRMRQSAALKQLPTRPTPASGTLLGRPSSRLSSIASPGFQPSRSATSPTGGRLPNSAEGRLVRSWRALSSPEKLILPPPAGSTPGVPALGRTRLTRTASPGATRTPLSNSQPAPAPVQGRTRPKPPTTLAKSKPAPPPDGQCQARTRKGTRCQNWSEGARGNVCDMHLDMVAQGKTVLWHTSGKPIRLRKS